jgi:hypothetical protein
MADTTKSSRFAAQNRDILVTQGLRDCTLVAGKTTMVRLSLSRDEANRFQFASISITGIAGDAQSGDTSAMTRRGRGPQ